jgi:hypothetical protein
MNATTVSRNSRDDCTHQSHERITANHEDQRIIIITLFQSFKCNSIILLVNVWVPGTHVIDFPLIYIIKLFQFTPIPITPVRPGTHPRRKSRATCTVSQKYWPLFPSGTRNLFASKTWICLRWTVSFLNVYKLKKEICWLLQTFFTFPGRSEITYN